MNYEDYIMDAIYTVSAWNLSDIEFIQRINEKACLMAGIEENIVDFSEPPSHIPLDLN
ncbi:hypothetical protein [Marinobacterium rhizophilum]|uniref:hypothetical protein n=1 Tax=Marinobacterium rhizophilum TaxID=420402 RepID=UPI00036C8BB2|nr:hypothetical protein [Marinobacterium rhizophilum]